MIGAARGNALIGICSTPHRNDGAEVPHLNMPAKCGRCLIYFCPRNLGYTWVSLRIVLLVVLLVVFRCERWVVSRVLRLPGFELSRRRAG